MDWDEFRPLRTQREEDWSDWLAWLLKTSQTGILAHTLFGEQVGFQPDALALPMAEREKTLVDRRADIVITWRAKGMTHIEVKIDDKDFAKTYETARELREKNPGEWCDFILIPERSKPAWLEVEQVCSLTESIKIMPILWDDVVRGLRRSLWARKESVLWCAWAWTFCSVIEKKVLRLNPPKSDASRPEIQPILHWLSILKINPEEKYE